MTYLLALALVLAGAALDLARAECPTPKNGPSISYEAMRACGELDWEHESALLLCASPSGEPYKCRKLGVIDRHNVIQWEPDVSIEDLKEIIQSRADYDRTDYVLRKPKNPHRSP